MTAHRRSHAKSRLGCRTCKSRRVKCDEVRPRCGKCLKLGLKCSWNNRKDDEEVNVATPQTTSTRGSGNGLETAHGTSNNGTEQIALGVADLHLLHHWIVLTANATFFTKALHNPWREELVAMSFEQPYLLHAMLALSAMHKAWLGDGDDEQLRQQSSIHLDITLRSFNEYLQQPDPATSSPMFAAAILLVLHKFAEPQIEPSQDVIGDTCSWLGLLKGVGMLIRRFPELFEDSVIWQIIQNEDHRVTHLRDPNPKGFIPEIHGLHELVEQLHGDRNTVLTEGIDKLHKTMLNLRVLDGAVDHRALHLIFTWPIEVDAAFIELVAARDVTALVMLAHFAAIFNSCRGHWFIRNWSTWIIEAVEASVPREYVTRLQWPKQVIARKDLPAWHEP